MNNKIPMTFLFLLINLVSYSSADAQKHQELLSELFESRYSPDQPGSSILISKKGEIIYEKQIGLANVEFGIPMNRNSKFSIGSITKQFTAAAILMLEEDELLKVSDDINKYIKGFTQEGSSISIEHLLTHTSGIPDYPRVTEVREKIRNNLSPQEIIDIVKEKPSDFSPGTQTRYSNTGYLILGKIIEKVSNKSYLQFLHDNIFQKLDMTSTTVSDYQKIVKNRVQGYSEDENDKIINATFHSSSFSAGAIVSTPSDLNKWITALFNGELLSAKSLDQMLTNYSLESGQKINLGYGWEINKLQGYQTYEHSGFEPGYKCNSIYIPEEQLYVVVLQNNEYGSPTPTMIKAAAICANKPYPSKNNSANLSPSQKKDFVGTYKISEDQKRIIGLVDGQIYIKAPGGKPSHLYALNENTLYYKDGYRQLRFDKAGSDRFQNFTYSNRRLITKGVKISDEIPKEKTAIEVDQSILSLYLGSYQSEQMNLNITMENEVLYIQPEGSNKLPLTPIGENAFVIKEMGAEVNFSEDKEGILQFINILIEGNTMVLEKKKG